MKSHHWSKKELDKQFGFFMNLSELIKKIEAHFLHTNNVICQIEVNDLLFRESDEEKWAQTSSQEIFKVSVKTSEVDELLVEAIQSTIEYIKRLKSVSLKCSDVFRTDDLNEAQLLLEDVIEGVQWVTDMVTHISVVYTGKENGPEQERWIEAQTRFKSILNELMGAVQIRDFVSVADILEYDWTTILDQWLNLLSGLNSHGQGSAVDEQSAQNSLG